MRAFAVTDFDQPGSVVELPDPVPGDGEILVRVRAASINPFDSVVASGGTRAWPAETRVPLIPGVDAAGVVAAVGPGAGTFKVGDEVVLNAGGKSYWGGGTFAELVTIPENAAARKPPEMPFEVAAAVPQTGLTALSGIDALELKPGQVVLVTGATGGVGSFFVQLAKLRGATVIALARPGNADYARAMGANDVFDHTQPDLTDRIRGAFPDGVDALADFSGSPELVAALSGVVRDGGRVASSIGKAREAVPQERGVTVHAANMVDRSRLPEVLAPLAQGRITAPEITLIGLDETAAALAEAGQKHGVGKTVINLS